MIIYLICITISENGGKRNINIDLYNHYNRYIDCDYVDDYFE